MAKFEVLEAPPGQGKSYCTAEQIEDLLLRNYDWNKKYEIDRKVYSNMRFSKDFEEKWSNKLFFWNDVDELVELRDCDIIWDEIANELDSRSWASLSTKLKRWLSRYRKYGVDIYANTQDFSMVDQRARIMITKVIQVTKIIGSGDPSPTKPKQNRVWGIIMKRSVINWKEISPEKKKLELIPTFTTIQKRIVNMYDTREDIAMKPLPNYAHIERICEKHGKGCEYAKTTHE